MRGRTFVIAAAVSIAALGLAACSQNEPTTTAQKTYQGKPDARPWDSPEWGGDQTKWERAIQTRTMNQNEYTRTQ